MTACKAIAKLLKLNKILKIVDFRFCRDGSLRLDVKPFKNGARCRECGRRSRLVRRRAVARQWRDLPVARLTSGETYRWRDLPVARLTGGETYRWRDLPVARLTGGGSGGESGICPA